MRGELSPTLFGRVDLAKYLQSGLAVCRNWFVDFRGGATTRAGTMFVTACKSAVTTGVQCPRLWPFTVSTIATYMLEFGHLYIRFISNGVQVQSPPGTPVEVTTPYGGVRCAAS